MLALGMASNKELTNENTQLTKNGTSLDLSVEEVLSCSESLNTKLQDLLLPLVENIKKLEGTVGKLEHDFGVFHKACKCANITKVSARDHEVSLLQQKIQEQDIELNRLREENSSLLTVIKMLSADDAFSGEPDCGKNEGWNEVKKKSKCKGNKANASEPIAKGSSPAKDETKKPAKSIIIAGDSILKNLEGWKISKEPKVQVSSFPGCTTKDMVDHVKPLLRKKPDELILQVGTNSLRSSKSPTACAEEIINLVSTIKNEASNTTITISSLITRTDDEHLSEGVKM